MPVMYIMQNVFVYIHTLRIIKLFRSLLVWINKDLHTSQKSSCQALHYNSQLIWELDLIIYLC